MGRRSLHEEDFSLHDFKTLIATLEDGRVVELVMGRDGHLEIIKELPASMGVETTETSQPQEGQPAGPGVTAVNESGDIAEMGYISSLPSTILPQYVNAGAIDPNLLKMMQHVGLTSKPPTQKPKPQPQQAPPKKTADPLIDSLEATKKPEPKPDPKTEARIEKATMAEGEAAFGWHPGQSAGAGVAHRIVFPKEKFEPALVLRDPAFLARLSSVMNDNQFDRKLRGRSRGKLDMTRLYKAQTGSASIFSQKLLRRNKRYNIALLLDESGSMYGDPGNNSQYENMAAAKTQNDGNYMSDLTRIGLVGTVAQFLAQHFDRIPGLELMIVGFSSFYGVHKEFGQNVDLNQLRSRVILEGTRHLGGGTEPTFALAHTYETLRHQEKGENIVLLLTDGEVNQRRVTQSIIKKNADTAMTFDIGIMSTPQLGEKKYQMKINNLAGLKPALIKILEKEVQRG